jgi:hypothetical protein
MEIMNSDTYKANPQKFMDDWDKLCSNKEKLCILADPARKAIRVWLEHQEEKKKKQPSFNTPRDFPGCVACSMIGDDIVYKYCTTCLDGIKERHDKAACKTENCIVCSTRPM